jgi:hypothetical protein
MSWCEGKRVDYVFGLARNQRLRKIIGRQMQEATVEWTRTGKPARVFTEFRYQTRKTKKRGWDRERRVVAKAEHIDGKENPRFVVTSLSPEQWAAQEVYEELYCARGDMENRIKEQFSLFADRVSAETMRGQSTASVLLGNGLCAGQRIAAAGIKSNRVCASASSHDPYEVAEDRSASTGDGPQGLDLDGLRLSVARRVSASLVELTLLTQHLRGNPITRTSPAEWLPSSKCAFLTARRALAPLRTRIDSRYFDEMSTRFRSTASSVVIATVLRV